MEIPNESFRQLLQRKHCMQYASLCTSYVASQPHTAQLYYCQQLALGRSTALSCSVCCATSQQANLQQYNNKRSKPFSTVQQRSPLPLEENRLSAFHETNRKATKLACLVMMMITTWLGQFYFSFLYNGKNGLTSSLQIVATSFV